MRTYLLALGLATIVLGLFLLLAGYVGIGCTVGGTRSNPTLSNCGAAIELEAGGGVMIVAAILMFAGSVVPDSSSRYQ